ncbi:basic proline-rich protein-like [Apus apus]|uniref:basic proline-rich protein-like n=1 Tax=Apus apus TaxID=8895 RepID=UPI0021F8DAF1|nr:basic proline-rich protein-like [Apus apus]
MAAPTRRGLERPAPSPPTLPASSTAPPSSRSPERPPRRPDHREALSGASPRAGPSGAASRRAPRGAARGAVTSAGPPGPPSAAGGPPGPGSSPGRREQRNPTPGGLGSPAEGQRGAGPALGRHPPGVPGARRPRSRAGAGRGFIWAFSGQTAPPPPRPAPAALPGDLALYRGQLVPGVTWETSVGPLSFPCVKNQSWFLADTEVLLLDPPKTPQEVPRSWHEELVLPHHAVWQQWIESSSAAGCRMLVDFSSDCKWRLDLSAKCDPRPERDVVIYN